MHRIGRISITALTALCVPFLFSELSSRAWRAIERERRSQKRRFIETRKQCKNKYSYIHTYIYVHREACIHMYICRCCRRRWRRSTAISVIYQPQRQFVFSGSGQMFSGLAGAGCAVWGAWCVVRGKLFDGKINLAVIKINYFCRRCNCCCLLLLLLLLRWRHNSCPLTSTSANCSLTKHLWCVRML